MRVLLNELDESTAGSRKNNIYKKVENTSIIQKLKT